MNTYCDQLRVHRLYIGLENQAWLYEVKDDTVVRTAVPELQCQQREADSRLVWHANHISEKQPYCKLVIQCDDTDILLNMLPDVSSFNIHVWMDVGKSSNNTRHYIDVTDLAQELGPGLCQDLLGFHHFTGSDHTAAFFMKGKIRPLQIMEKSYVDTFSQL